MTPSGGEVLPLRENRGKLLHTALGVTALALTILAGAGLRFLFPGDAPFAADEAFALVLGGDYLQNPRVALHGMPSSVGIANPPAGVYFFAAIHALSGGDPLTATLVVIGWNVLGLVLAGLYLGSSRRLGTFWAWWGVAFLCLSPWPVLLSRKIWAQDLLLPLVVAAIWGLEPIWSGRWNWLRIGIGAASALVASQTHLSGAVWIAALAPFCVLLWPKENRRRAMPFLLLCAGVFLVLYLPWLIHLLQKGLGGRVPSGETGFWKRGIRALWQLFSVWAGLGFSLDFFFGAREAPFSQYMGTVWTAGQRLLCLAACGAMAAALILVLCALKNRSADSVLPASTGAIFLFPVFLILSGVPVYPHYGAVLLFPAAAALAGGGDAIESRWGRKRAARRLIRGAACLVLTLHLWSTLGFFARIHAAGGTQGDYGATLDLKTREIAKMHREGQKDLSASAPLEYHYLLDRLKGRRTWLEDHPQPY